MSEYKYICEEPDGLSQKEAVSFLEKHWGSKEIVSMGKIVDASDIPRIVARDVDSKLVGLATYSINVDSKSCELVTIDAVISGRGIGSELLKRVEEKALDAGCKKVWLITTNDNLEAAIFYSKKGYRLVSVHLDSIHESRKLKPNIPKYGNNGIELLDEWKFEKLL